MGIQLRISIRLSTPESKIVIAIETLLRGMPKASRDLAAFEKQLKALSTIKPSVKAFSTDAVDKAVLASQKLQQQQQRLAIQSQELSNRQERARQVSERLTLSQQRLNDAQQRVARSAGLQADAHVQAFKAIEKSRRADEAALKRAPQLDAHVKAFRAIQEGADDADSHVRAFRATEAALAKAPQLDAHVRAFRAAEEASKSFNKQIAAVGNTLRNIGQGISNVGTTLTAAVTVPLAALGVVVVRSAVQLDSLKRGLTAIAGSSDEAGRELARLTRLAKLPGIGFQEAIQGSIRLQAVGFSAREAEKDLKEFSNAVALTGGGRDELTRVTVQLGQLAAKGKVLSQDLKPIIEAAPAVGSALLKAFGTVNSEDIQALGLSSKEFLNILVSELERLPRAAAGAKNSFENFQDALFRAAATVGEVLLPVLTRFIEVVEPIVTALATAFSKLPVPLQVVVIGFAGLLAALGPVLFITGRLTSGISGLLIGFVQLNSAGILPTIRNLRALIVGTLSAAQANRTLAATTALVTGAFGLIAAAVTIAVGIYAAYKATQKDSIQLSKAQADALTDQIDGLKKQAEFLGNLQSGVKRTADEQERLSEIYDGLNRTAKVRVTGIKDEEQRLAALREEIAKLIALREQERIQQAASITAELANNLLKIQANQDERDSIAGRIQANAALVETLEKEQVISAASTRALAERGITASTVEDAIGALKVESENLSRSQDDLITSGKELADLTKDEVEIVRALERQTGLTARQLLIAAKNTGAFRGDVAAIIPVLERYIAKTDEATKSTDRLNASLSENARQLNQAGERADQAAKARQTIIQSAAAVARETSVNFEGALKSLRQMVDAVPELAAALKRESELTGKTLDALLHDSLESAFKGRAKDKSGTSLRNAQEELAKALAEVALASSEEQVRIEKDKNDRLLKATEVAQQLQLISYREFLEARAALAAASISREIVQQVDVFKAAKAEQVRLLATAQVPGISSAERTKRQAQAAKANEEAIKAESKLKDLTSQREQIQVELQQSLRLAQHEQIKDIRQLDIELAELQGRIEDAFNADVVDQFREKLVDLGKAQLFIAKLLETAQKKRDADAVTRLTTEQRLNKEQIDAVRLIVQQREALGPLAAAQELVRRAKEKQQQLEQDLAFQVEFQGLKEEDAIKRRLEGEQKLNDSLTLAHETIRQIVAALQARGVEPPHALIEFLDQLRTEVKGLGELPFSEQFRLAQKEFERINDERLHKIADVERAVRNRDIAEVEGAIIIRRINGQYTADLEQQLQLLKQIANASNDRGLQRQASDAAETVKDTKDEVAGLSKQIDAAGKDAFRSGLTDFFNDILNRTATAKEALLNLLNSITTAISNVIAENLSKELFESLFGGPKDQTGAGLIAGIKRFFGFGGKDTGAATEAATHVTETAAHSAEATAAATALTTGATAAATALTTGGATASATILSGITAAAASFAAAVTAAGAAFAASVAAAGASQAVGGLGGALGAAKGDFLSPSPGGRLVNVVEAGYPEAILTTDPKHASRQYEILRTYLAKTRGLWGRIPRFAEGAFLSPRQAEMNLLSTLPTVSAPASGVPMAALANAGGGVELRFRQILTSEGLVKDYLNSSEGETVIVNTLVKNQALLQRIVQRRR